MSDIVESQDTSSLPHGSPAEDSTCKCCWDDLRDKAVDDDEANYVEYRVAEDAPWLPSGYCELCARHLIETSFNNYLENVKKADCARALRNLLSQPPPAYLACKEALPVEQGQHIAQLWYASSDTVESPRLKDSVIGDEQLALWEKLKEENKLRYKDEGEDEAEGEAEGDAKADAKAEGGDP